MSKRKRYESSFKKEAVKAAENALKHGGSISGVATMKRRSNPGCVKLRRWPAERHLESS